MCALALLGMAGAPGCAARRVARETDLHDPGRLAMAQGLVSRGYYAALQEALAIATDVHSRARAGDKARTAEQLARTALLVASREREFAMADSGALAIAEGALAECADPAALQAALTLVRFEPREHRGMAGSDTQGLPDDTRSFRQRFEASRVAATVLEGLAADELYAYILPLWSQSRSRPAPAAGDEEPRSEPASQPTSRLLLYRSATREGDPRRFEHLLELEPRFAEAHYFLGARLLDGAPRAADLARAQEHLVAALLALPGSAAVLMAMGDLRFALADWESGIESYDRTLVLAPTHRQALLRKAICMSLLSRYEDGLAVLDSLAGLPGGYLPGETHYWIAWNLRRLGRLSETEAHVARAKVTLSGESRVYVLAGQIAQARDRLDEARSDFNKAVELNGRECAAHAGLGAIEATRRRWPSASRSYERAALCQAAAIDELDGKLKEIRAASLPESAKARVVARHLAEREALLLSRATSALNAAAGAFNAGDQRRAAELAEDASHHPLLAEKALALMEKIGPRL